MSDIYYLIDNNALLELGSARRATTFFKRRCRVTADVAHEAGGRARSLPPPIKVTPRVLERLVEIMRAVEPVDTDLIDLYGNKGAADPGMVATAMVLSEVSQDSLFPETWVVVSRDRAVLTLAARHGVPTLKPDELNGIVDATPMGT